MKSKLFPVTIVCIAVNVLAVPAAQADGLSARAGGYVQGSHGAAARNRGIVADGQGNAAGSSHGTFSTADGGQGQRTRRFTRSSDGSISAIGYGSASGANGNVQQQGNFTRNADGTASGSRTTTATNANTDVTFEGSTRYTKGSGVTRSASCTDAAGNTVACVSR